MTTSSDARIRGSESRLLRGYGPVVCLGLMFAVIATFAPTVAPEEVQVGGGPAGSGLVGGATDADDPSSPSATAAPSPTATTTDDVAGPEEEATGSEAVSCDGLQVPGDPYSPPCRTWDGTDNGGATARGVSADTITVSLRDPGLYSISDVVEQATGQRQGGASTSSEAFIAAYTAAAEYFNERFELYGRRIVVEPFTARGSVFDEILGGGASGANADGLSAAEEIGAFADVSLETVPFAEALTNQGVIVTNPLYPSQDWYADRQPHAWTSILPDCDKPLRATQSFLLSSVVARPAAYAGPGLQGKDRKVGLIYPETPTYKACADKLRDGLAAAGHPAADVRLYPVSIDGMPSAAQSIVAAFADQGITTVVLAADALLPYFMTNTAEQSGYYPEWVVAGIGFMDVDFVGQIYEPSQWSRAFGVSLQGRAVPYEASLPYQAVRSVDPSISPDPVVLTTAFYQLYLVAIGAHLAGPDLTPQSFAAGLRTYSSPEAGPEGRWAFPDGEFSPAQDVRVIAWDPNATSAFNDRPGAYRDTGTTYPIDAVPETTPPFP